MAEENEIKKEPSNQDWNKDRFPTSAMPVFRGLGLLLMLIGALCLAVYSVSDHEAEELEVSDQKLRIEDKFFADEDLID